MSNTYKHKDYGKWRRNRTPCSWIEYHRFSYHKCPRDSKTAKYVIQTLGHRRRRAAERKVYSEIKAYRRLWTYCCDYDWYDHDKTIDNESLEFYNEGKILERKFSDVWDYY